MPHKVIPIFRIFDYDKAVEFYVHFLGFSIAWQHQPPHSPVYMEVRLEDITLHLSEHHGDCTPGAKVFIETSGGLRDYHEQLLAKNYKYNRPGLEVAPWEALTMEVNDPFNNKLLFSEPLPKNNII
ncbi:glyoxalase superfamily protein [Aridibaculum aurantiacum]|uniref:glyoxalase superfamily protein n=1 Tax=Aridibaculum aurantiacum TaxID=2810307 RepID=UPI001A975425|nr:glyoxalase superfamily protein [Aridibaculum aurantiacum]